MRPVCKFFVIACLSSAAILPAAAQADVAPPAVQAFLDNLERQISAKPAYDALKDDGGTVTLTNFMVAKPAQGDEPALTLKVGELTFSDITDEGQTLYQVGKATFSNTSLEVSGKDFGFTAAIPQAGAEGWYIRALGANPTTVDELLATSSFARKMSTGPITLTASGQSLSVDGIDASWNGDPKTGSGSFNMKVNNVAIPDGVMALMDQGGMLKQLGYSSLNLDFATMGDMKVEGDTLAYSFNVSLAGRDMGSLSIGASLEAIPLAAYAAIMKAQMDGKEPDFTALMPQLQNVVVKGGSLRFEDASIVNRLLPVVAAAQGIDERTFRASIPPTLQLMLIQLQNEAFTKQAVEAVTAFFENPKSLTISLNPSTPTTVSDLQLLDPSKPGETIAKLGARLTAND